MSTSTPILTNTIPQSIFVDSLVGPQSIISLLTNFPDTVYSKAIDSHLVILMYALLGPTGAGLLTQEYFEERLQTEAGNITASDLDALYTGAFSFQRLAEESYLWDTESQLLPLAQRAEVLEADASFRNRARLWMQAIRAGGSTLGISLAASSGLGQNVEAIENYRALFDQYTDLPLGLAYAGSSVSLDEVILIPRNNVPQNVAETFTFSPNPTSGYFTITVPIGPPYITAFIEISAMYNPITVPNSDLFHVGGWVNINGTVYTVTEILGPTSILLSTVPPSDYVGQILIGYAETSPIAWDATANDIQSSLSVLAVIGGIQNVICTGGPLPDSPVNVVFTGALANTSINQLIIQTNADTPSGSSGLTPSGIVPIVTTGTLGVEADGLEIEFAESDLALMIEAVNILRPQTTFITVNDGQSLYTRQPANSYFADQTYTEVPMYVTGNPSIAWPPVDNIINWIESGIEHEAPELAGGFHSQYTNFHNILTAIAYNQNALLDGNYNTPQDSPNQPFYEPYWDSHIGQFSQVQQLLYPLLAQYQQTSQIFLPTYAIAQRPNQPQITAVTESLVALINDNYPASYLNLPGVNYQLTANTPFWSSSESPTGVDYLEIDLGTVQPVNFIYFEATNKPYAIDVAYEVLDQPNIREFIPAVVSNVSPSVTSLTFEASNVNPWTTVYLPITNSLNMMVYTRYIRLGFTRTSDGEPFISGKNLIPYSIEVRNLRIGRVVNSFGETYLI